YVYGFPPIAPGFPFPAYGSIDRRVTVQIINPAGIVVQSRRVGFRPTYDTTGIDLDVESPDKIWGPKKSLAKAAPKNGEMVKAPLPEVKKQQVAAPAKPPPPLPRPEPPTDGKRLVDLGIAAFRKGEFGSAFLRFRQASEADPPGPRTAFLRG